MSATVLKIDTFGCEMCGYYQDFNALDEPQKHVRLFPTVPAGTCPACFMGQNQERVARICPLTRIIDLATLTTTTSASDADLEQTMVEDTDEHGQPIMVQTGERQEIGIVNGKIGIITVPVYEPKMRSLTPPELAELKEQRDRNLDVLEGIAVKEVS